VGIASSKNGAGYWVATSTGRVERFGDALPLTPSLPPGARPTVVGIASTPSGEGYWLVTSSGEVINVGDADHHGDVSTVVLNQPVTGVASTPTGDGYWLVARDGGVFSFGDAVFRGSLANTKISRKVIGMSAAGPGGYVLVAADGGVFTFGTAAFHGSLGAGSQPEPAVGIVATAGGGGYWVALTGHLAPASARRAKASYLQAGANQVGGAGEPRAGTYRQLAPTSGCTWTVRNADGDVVATGGGPGRNVVRIRPRAASFSSSCGTWTTDLFPTRSSPELPAGDGTWLLGTDVRAGRWTAPGGTGCQWSRLADVSGLPSGVLDQGGADAPQTVTLTGAEVAFRTAKCGTWSPA
jgi:hypothetical protein